MNSQEILDRISGGRTDLVFDLLRLPDWRRVLHEGQVKPLQWFVYYNDVTALKAVLEAGGDLDSISLDNELGHAAFFGHWKVCDFLIQHGANVNAKVPETGETPLHGALAKAYAGDDVISYLLDHGADREARDANGDSPLSWASEHLRPGSILALLTFGPHRISEKYAKRIVSDHGAGWGNGMEWKLVGEYLPEEKP